MLLLLPFPLPAGASPPVSHELTVRIDPGRNTLAASDRITFTDGAGGKASYEFYLHEGMNPRVEGDGARLTSASEGGYGSRYILEVAEGAGTVTMHYGGVINHPLQAVGEEYARGQRATVGSISPEGVFLAPASLWYPAFDGVETFTLRIDLPEDWDAVSQGERREHRVDGGRRFVTWEERNVQRGIYLVAGRYREYLSKDGDVTAMVFLRSEDEALAGRYLEATHQYVGMYSDLLGPYPYRKFALVENFWETGYGMPSFTLLGPRVVRFPFILHSSYPHEILHNWWGNGVFIDSEGGNWGEGLTAYLADHLIKEQRGDAVLHRRTVLQKYADYVLTERDLPLTGFRSRHGSVSEAVGYGKSLMFFHMLRRRLGDEKFTEGLRLLYREKQFDVAAYDDVRKAFEKAADLDLASYFAEWTTREGAPVLALADVELSEGTGERLLRGTLRQLQEEPFFPLEVPLVLTYKGEADAAVKTVVMSARDAAFSFELPGPLARLDVDPFFDVFRRLDRSEIPPALSRAFGSEKALVILPSEASVERRRAYEELAASLRRTGPGSVDVVSDRELQDLPADRSVWVLGWENLFFDRIPPSLQAYDLSFGSDNLRLERSRLPRKDHTFVLTARNPAAPEETLLWIAFDDAQAAPGLARKLPHYHKYSYLAFEGAEPANVAKGQWPVTDSPLTRLFTEGDAAPPAMGDVPRRRPLAELKPRFATEMMMQTVAALSAPGLEGRGIGAQGLAEAARYLAGRFAEAGITPSGGNGGYLQRWDHAAGAETYGLANVVGIVRGSDPSLGPVILGAHYDGLGMGSGTLGADVRLGNTGLLHPGADDNASGVAVLLETARSFGSGWKPLRTVYFVAFTAEETGRLGSRHFLRSLASPEGPPPFAMINLDTVGRLEGRKFLILGGSSASEWVHIFRGAGFLTGVETQMVSEELDASDQITFIEAGIPAVQISTGPSPDYHRPGDKADKLDLQGLVKAASLTRAALEYLADRKDPLSAGGTATDKGPSGSGRRTVLLGTVPDFAFGGAGVLLTGTVAGSPAEKAGLRAGDIVTALDGNPLAGLRDLSAALKKLAAGSKVTVTFLRDGQEMEIEAHLEAR